MSIYMPKGAHPEGRKNAWALPDFDEEMFSASEAGKNVVQMREIYNRYPEDEMNPEVIKYWEEQGIRKELYDAKVNGGKGKYSVFTPLDMSDMKRYALLYNSHGGRNTINFCETTGMAALVGKEKFICVCPWNGGESNDEVETEFPRILEALLKKGYPVDMSRIYAAGFSSGSDATGVLASAFPDVIAAVSPDPGGNLFAKGQWYKNSGNYQRCLEFNRPMPIICIGGTMDGGDRYPFTAEEHYQNFNIWMEKIVHVSGYEPVTLEKSGKISENSADRTKSLFGLDFHNTYQFSMEGMKWYTGEFYGDNSWVIARFIMGDGLPHIQTKYHFPIIWDFLKHFSRDTHTGESIYAPVVIDGIRD